jgi:hypothetical protein
LEVTHGSIGYVPGTIKHYWHGKKVDRGYGTRYKILADRQYNPAVDTYKSTTGVLEFTHNNLLLERDVEKYFKVRNEDSIDI